MKALKETQLTTVYNLIIDGYDVNKIKQQVSKAMIEVIAWYLASNDDLDSLAKDIKLSYITENKVHYNGEGMRGIIWYLSDSEEIIWDATTGKELDISLLEF